MTTARREFLKTGAAAGAGLLLGIPLVPGKSRRANPAGPGTFAPNAWLRIDSDGRVTILVAHSEMGQGVATALPMLVAEELEVDWRTVAFEMAPAHPAYDNVQFMTMGTAGSSSVRESYTRLRKAGAAARIMLIAAAARQWGVLADGCHAENGAVVHTAGARRAGYGALAAAAAQEAVPLDPPLKPRTAWTILGTRVKRLDSRAKVTGAAEFGMDVKRPGMLTAVVERCPVFGGSVRSFDARAARGVPGVRDVRQIASGVAVIADGYWAATQGRAALTVTWNEGPNAANTSEAIRGTLRAAAQGAGHAATVRKDRGTGVVVARRLVEATYELPLLAHTCMEPMNCTADVRPDRCEVWAPTQFQRSAQVTAADIAGLPVERVAIHTPLLGGGFGRRVETDFVAEAVELSKLMGAPVKVIFSREDDVQHDFYRPAAVHVLTGGVGADGLPVSWSQRIAAPSIIKRMLGPQFAPFGRDPYAVEGAADLPYAIPNITVASALVDVGVPVGYWRSVGHSHTAFVKECFVDELAAAGGLDPVALRRTLLARHPRLLGVLNLAAQRAGWGTPLPAGRARGVAVHESFGSFVAEVVEVGIASGAPRVYRVVCAADCGTVLNPAIVEAQMEGSIVYGLTAALYGEITIDRGRVVQGNFDSYPPLRMDAMPAIEVHILPSNEEPGGAGEPGLPPIAPAVANALGTLTGVRIRRLPIRADDLRSAAP